MFQSDFPIAEFRSRRDAVCQAIGSATALVAGAPASNGSFAFRQYNDFYYLCGVEVPHAYLAIDGDTGKTTLFLPDARHQGHDSDDPLLCAEQPEYAREATGVDRVAGRDQLAPHLERVSRRYTFLRDGEGLRACVRSLHDARVLIEADPWDGQPSRGAHLCAKLKARFPKLAIEDLAPIVYEMRMHKSPREITLLRRAGQLSALGLREAMRATGPQWMFTFRQHLAHSVGLSVHDGLSHKDAPLRPGIVFAVDPQMKIEADRLYLRVEDTGVVTENGFDVFTKDAPLELDAIEAAMRGASLTSDPGRA